MSIVGKEITSYDEFKVGKKYKRITAFQSTTATCTTSKESVFGAWVKGGQDEWEALLGLNAKYYEIESNKLEGAEEL